MADRALNLRVENARLTAEITALRADLDRTIAERDEARARAYDLAVAIMGGEDAPGYADSVPTEDLVKQARDSELARECEMLTAGMDALRARAEKAEAAAAGLAVEAARAVHFPLYETAGGNIRPRTHAYGSGRTIADVVPFRPKETSAPTCPRRQTPMQPGKAIAETYRGGIPDFPSDEHASTFSVGGPGRLIDCLKCPSCGHSVTEYAR